MSECAPTVSADVASAALPLTSGDVPSDVAPSKNCTVPEGEPAPGGVTVTLAVSVVDCPNSVGFGALVINGLLFMLADAVVPGVEISGCITAVLASLGVTFVNWAMHFVVGRWAP